MAVEGKKIYARESYSKIYEIPGGIRTRKQAMLIDDERLAYIENRRRSMLRLVTRDKSLKQAHG